jgi:hypothetical protein
MNSRDRQLDRLFKSARQAASPERTLSWTQQQSVLAAWRKARANGETFDWLPLLHRAVAVACIITVVVAAATVTFKQPPAQQSPDELTSLNEQVNAAANWL